MENNVPFLNLSLNDFELIDYDENFYSWHSNKSLDLPMGTFSIILITSNSEPPDAAMLALVNQLVHWSAKYHRDLLKKIFDHYNSVVSNEATATKVDVPMGLPIEAMGPLLENREITVNRDFDKSPPYEARISFLPCWELEHSIEMELRGEDLEFVEPS